MNDPESAPDAVPPSPPVSEPDGGPYAVLKNRDFLLYLCTRFIGSFAQQMLVTAVGWEIFERTGSTLDLGYVGLVQMIPMFLFVFPAGHVADNYSRKRVIFWALLGVTVSCLGLLAVSFWHGPVIWTYACLFLLGTARTYWWPASVSFLPQIVSRAQFPRAVTWNTGTFQIAAVAGPALGGALIALTGGAAVVYAFNVVAGLVCMVMISLVTAHGRVAVREKMSLHSVVVGLRFIFHSKIVLGSITLDMFAVLLGGATAMLPVYAKTILHVGPNGLGWLQAALPLGSLFMSLIMLHRPPLQKAGRTLLWAVALFGLATAAFGLSHWFWLSFLMLFASGATDYISVVVRHTLVQIRTPDEMRGRVSAVNSLFIGTSNQLGEFESGVVANFTTPQFSVVSGGLGTILVVIAAACLWPEIRRYGRLDA